MCIPQPGEPYPDAATFLWMTRGPRTLEDLERIIREHREEHPPHDRESGERFIARLREVAAMLGDTRDQ